ncbi:MAG: FAS1-like dehydratase domain-containing protein [Solirubrobacteraceae bacterium]
MGAWDEAQALVGRTIGRLSAPDAASRADIRRKLEVMGLEGPLHRDAEHARRHGYRDVVAPVSMTSVWALPAHWEPGRPRIGSEDVATPVAAADVPGEGDTIVAPRVRREHFEPLYPGDRVSAGTVRAVTPKRTRIGDGTFLELETTVTNRRGDAVTVETASVSRLQRDERDGDG